MAGETTTRIEDGIAWIHLDDGVVNALSAARLGELDSALSAAEAEGAVAVLQGREGIFSAGFDLKTFGRGTQASVEMVLAGARLIERLLSFPHPVLAVCTGHAYPMGAFLMLSSDVRIAAAGPYRIGMNEVAIGMTVPNFALELARHRLTPPGFARVTTAAMFDPEEALRYGYVDRVVPPSQLGAVVREEASRLRGLDMPSYAATKARVNAPALRAIGKAIELDMEGASGGA